VLATGAVRHVVAENLGILGARQQLTAVFQGVGFVQIGLAARDWLMPSTFTSPKQAACQGGINSMPQLLLPGH